jgi:hypothetical protein
MRLIGDIHGDLYTYKLLCESAEASIQIGDFGIGFGQSDYWHESVDAYNCAGHNRFIRGNHDNPARCRTMQSWIADGTVEDDIMFIGGAWSIDNPEAPPGWYRRTVDVSWWADEECSDDEFERMFEVYQTARPRIMITHDCPAQIADQMFWKSGIVRGPQYTNRTSAALDRFYEAHQPEYWFFGHWHRTSVLQQDTCFVCVGELDYIDLDLNDMESSLMRKFIGDKHG